MHFLGAMKFAVLAFATAVGSASAQIPSKPVRIIVGVGPGSGSDAGARSFAQALAKTLDRTVTVENKPGASTGIAVQEVVKAPADGNTLLNLTNSTLSINPVLNAPVSYDPKSIRPIAGGVRGTAVLLTSIDSPYKTLQDMVVAMKKPGEAPSIAEYGGMYKLAAHRLEKQAGGKLVHVPYKSPTDGIANVMGRQVDVLLLEFGTAVALLNGGKVRALAQTGLTRSPMLPDVPTIAESYPGFSLYNYAAFAVRADTPEPVFRKLEQELLKTYDRADVAEFTTSRGNEPVRWTADDLKRITEKELAETMETMKSIGQK